MTYIYSTLGVVFNFYNYKFALLEEALVLLPYTNSSGLHYNLTFVYTIVFYNLL